MDRSMASVSPRLSCWLRLFKLIVRSFWLGPFSRSLYRVSHNSMFAHAQDAVKIITSNDISDCFMVCPLHSLWLDVVFGAARGLRCVRTVDSHAR
jgi:hypothetical protein